MTYRGVVKDGRIELQEPMELPDGTTVNVEVTIEDWLADAKKLAEDVTKKTPPGVSIVEEFLRSRR